MKIRKATSNDLESVLELSELMMKLHISFDVYYDIYTKYEDARKYYKEQLAKRGLLYVVAEDENKKIVAFASAYTISIPRTKAPKIGILVTNFVKEEYRGRGIGTMLYEYRMNWFKQKNVKYVEMNVDVRNTKALKLWKKYGFKEYQVKLKMEL